MQELITTFAGEIAQVRVLDPACGSGNFLYVALKQLLDLEKEVITFAGNLGLTRPFPQVGPEQLRGIEINEYAHELAQITVWIGYIQWLRDNGFGRPSEPILKPLDTIQRMDAILVVDAHGNTFIPEWPKADVIIGNPPFLGGKRLRTELGDEYVDRLFGQYSRQVQREADLVCYWFERTRQLIADNVIQRAGLLATNSIRGGANRVVLERIKESGDIFLAWADRPWILNGAAVRVSMVGFDVGTEHNRTLNGISAVSINADLTGALDLTNAKRLAENSGISFMGDTKVGPFDIDSITAQILLNAKGNPNGRPNSDVVVPWMNGMDVVRRPRNMWIIDFGVSTSEADASEYEAPFEYINKHVKPFRATAKSGDKTGVSWWLHQRTRPDMRDAIRRCTRFIATSSVSKYRIFVWLSREVLPDHALIVFTRDDDYFFGVLHSKAHELWALRMGTSLEDRPRYTPTTTFETFPFPWKPSAEPSDDSQIQAIAEAARELVQKRDNWLNAAEASPEELKKRTLTNLYNARPTWLNNAHKKLDDAVATAYGWPNDLTDDEILARLLRLNQQRFDHTQIIDRYARDQDPIFLESLVKKYHQAIHLYQRMQGEKPNNEIRSYLYTDQTINISSDDVIEEINQLQDILLVARQQLERFRSVPFVQDCDHTRELMIIQQEALKDLEIKEAKMMSYTPTHFILELRERRERYGELLEWSIVHCS